MTSDITLLFIISTAIPILLSWLLLRLIIRLWPRKGKMGINLEAVHCPECGAKAPPVRLPSTFQQALWGGWTCKQCGCEMDRYGKAIKTKT